MIGPQCHPLTTMSHFDDMARDAVAMTLRDLGCRVIAADSESAALRLLEAHDFPPQLIVSDYRLAHGKTGIEAARTLRDRQVQLYGSEFPLPAIIVSGDTSKAEMLRVQEAGFPMLHKPLTRRQLRVALNEALARL